MVAVKIPLRTMSEAVKSMQRRLMIVCISHGINIRLVNIRSATSESTLCSVRCRASPYHFIVVHVEITQTIAFLSKCAWDDSFQSSTALAKLTKLMITIAAVIRSKTHHSMFDLMNVVVSLFPFFSLFHHLVLRIHRALNEELA